MINKKNLNFYCKDVSLIENYDKAIADTTQTWDCHHRLKTHNSDGELRIVPIYKSELVALGMYYNRPASELIFLTVKEHRKLHANNKVTYVKISKAMKGKQFFNNGEMTIRAKECPEGFVPGKLYKYVCSEKTKIKLREAAKHRKPVSEETRKKHTMKNLGRKWWNNGVYNVYQKECPKGFVRGKLTKKKGEE